jgi:hypothetical protein
MQGQQEQRQGVVLQTHVWQTPRLLLFDQHDGKVIARVMDKKAGSNWSAGSLIRYTFTRKHPSTTHHIDNVMLWRQPQVGVYEDLLFMHHVLEILAAFLPDDAPQADVYQWYLQLYHPACQKLTYAQKIAWICNLFFKLGIYPPPTGSLYTFSYQVSLISHEQPSKVSEDYVGALEQVVGWLQHCLDTHPAEYRFKTNHFLHKARGY